MRYQTKFLALCGAFLLYRIILYCGITFLGWATADDAFVQYGNPVHLTIVVMVTMILETVLQNAVGPRRIGRSITQGIVSTLIVVAFIGISAFNPWLQGHLTGCFGIFDGPWFLFSLAIAYVVDKRVLPVPTP